MSNRRLLNRVVSVLVIAHNEAKKFPTDYRIANRIGDMRIHTKYSEPGYTSEKGVIITGNWNDIADCYNRTAQQYVNISTLPSRLERIFTKLGIDIEWSDEWRCCDDCYGLIRIEPDSHSWKASYKTIKYTYAQSGKQEEKILCMNCFNKSDLNIDTEYFNYGRG